MSEMREQVLKLLDRRPDITPVILAGYVSLPQSTALNFIAGVQEHISGPRVCKEFGRVLDLIDHGDILPAGQRTVTITDVSTTSKRVRKRRDFYQIATVGKVAQVIDYCAEHALIGVITGNYGLGKTEAVQHWRTLGAGKTTAHTVFEFNDFAVRSIGEFLFSLSELFGVTPPPGPRNNVAPAARIFEAVCDHLNANPQLLIFDQCETIQPRVAQVIRQIWDRTRHSGVGVVMLASPLLMDRMHRRRAEDLGALTSRVSIWAQLQGVSRGEAAEILRKEGVVQIEADALDLLCRMISGSMRRLMAVAQLLVDKHTGKTISVRTIEGVAEHLWGLSFAAAKRGVAA